MSPDRSGKKMRFLGDIVDPDEAADPAEMPPTFAEGDLVWFDQGTSPGTRGHRAVAFKCRVKDVFHVGFASYEFTVLPLIGASSRPLRCTTEQLKYAGVSGLDEVSARGVSSSSENVSMKRDLNKAVHIADAAERALATEVKYRGREGGP